MTRPSMEFEDLLAAARAEFRSRIGARLREIEEASARGDWTEARRAAHRLRGAAGTYGFLTVGEEAARMEDALASQANEVPDEAARDLFATALRAAMEAERALRGEP